VTGVVLPKPQRPSRKGWWRAENPASLSSVVLSGRCSDLLPFALPELGNLSHLLHQAPF